MTKNPPIGGTYNSHYYYENSALLFTFILYEKTMYLSTVLPKTIKGVQKMEHRNKDILINRFLNNQTRNSFTKKKMEKQTGMKA